MERLKPGRLRKQNVEPIRSTVKVCVSFAWMGDSRKGTRCFYLDVCSKRLQFRNDSDSYVRIYIPLLESEFDTSAATPDTASSADKMSIAGKQPADDYEISPNKI